MSNISGLGPRMRFTALPDRPQRLLKAYPHLLPLYAELARRSGPRAFVQVRQSVVAASLEVTVRTVKRHTADLKALGLIEVRRTRRTAITWLPDHANYSVDWEAYREKVAAKILTSCPQDPHMEGTPAHMEGTHEGTRGDTDVPSRGDTDVPSIEEEVLLEEVPSSRRPEGQAASDDGTTDSWGNGRYDGREPLAPVVARMHPDDPTRPIDAPDWDVHDDCGWTFRHPKHHAQCLTRETA